ncbi:MAG: methylenetetrahydrofolate reductase, partial [Anaerohalosphaera sp.]|nr:methylenetetrahydrofolate reductase [Anaerohalosphaera sp.]
EGRKIYMCTPEYMAEYSKRFFENGARLIGGCCGTTPQHIKEIARVVKSVDKADGQSNLTGHIEVVSSSEALPVGFAPVSLAEKSAIGRKLAAEQVVHCIEIVPPRGVDIEATLEKVRQCADYGIDAINIPDGPRASCRLSPMVTAAKIEEAADIEAILHVCCRDRNIIGMQSDMLGVHALGLRNVLLITGDPPKLGDYPNATAVFDLDSVALTRVVDNLNRGLDIAGNQLSGPLSLTLGVGANPVASDLHREIDRFARKVRAGAEYAITQPVFDTEMFYAFGAATAGNSVPLIAGIWPFTSFKNAEFMANEVPGVVVPDKLLKRMSKAKTKEQGRLIGIEIAREMMDEMSDHVAGFAVSAPFGNVRIALAVLGKIDPQDI